MFKKYKIKVRIKKDEKWFIPMRRTWLFFWTEKFKGITKGVESQSMRSTDINSAIQFIEDRRVYDLRVRKEWGKLLWSA